MHGLMQNWPLTVDKIIDHAALRHGKREVVSRSVEGPIVRTTYAEMRARAKQVSHALLEMGVRPGDRIATLAWNTARHMEVWYGIMSIGAVCHTLNPRLHPDQICWIADHAGDRMIFTDLTFAPILAANREKLPKVDRIVLMSDEGHRPDGVRRGRLHVRGLDRTGAPPTTRRGASSARSKPADSATLRARRATPRGCCIRTAPTSSTPSSACRPT